MSRFMSSTPVPARPPPSSEEGLHVSIELATPDHSRYGVSDDLPPKSLAIQRSSARHLPTLGISLVPLFRLLDYSKVATVVGACLTGQKILFVSRDVATLTQTVIPFKAFCCFFKSTRRLFIVLVRLCCRLAQAE